MNRKLLLMSVGLLLLVAVVFVSATGDKYEAIPISDGQELQAPSLRAACSMYYTSNTAAGFWSGYYAGEQTVSFFDPANPTPEGCGVASVYPFEITDFSFTLYDPGGNTWPVNLDVVVYDLDPSGVPCAGPGAELCRYSLVAYQATFGYPNVGTFTFPTPCCVNGPFYIGLEYTSGQAGSTPSILFDNTIPPPTCLHWFYRSDGTGWLEWYSQWDPEPGHPMFWVDGETVSGNCDDPWPNHKMHFPQLPDEDGWDVHAGFPIVLADDWRCSATGNVTDIHFWGSWYGDMWAPIDSFHLSIHADIPVDLANGIFYSRPGKELWTYVPVEGDYGIVDMPSTIYQGWYDPTQDPEVIIYGDHQTYFRYDVYLPEDYWFHQVEGTIYWLDIKAFVNDGYQGHFWGWKSTEYHFWDDAVYWNGLEWIDIIEPSLDDPIANFWEIQLGMEGHYVGGWGAGAFIDPQDPTTSGWYMYEEIGWPYWWNIWFWDHPLDTNRIKDAWLVFGVQQLEPGMPFWAEVTTNWATDIWTLEGMPPGTESRPPMPWDFIDGEPPESDWIGRGDPLSFDNYQAYDTLYRIRIHDYNPEWVSVDVRGQNVWVEGMFYHHCRSSLDLAFVITGEDEPEPEGACCYDPTGGGDNSDCVVTTQADCENNLGGVYQGDGTACQGVEACCLNDAAGTCVMADALCCVNELGGTPQGPGSTCTQPEACCMSDDACRMLDPLCCIDLGGTPQGAGSTCTQLEACCMPNNTCQNLDPLCCIDIGGAPQGPGSTCLGMEACCMPTGICLMADAICCLSLGGMPQGTGSVCTQLEACCMQNGNCVMLDPLCCLDLGGTPQGLGTACSALQACCFADGSCQDLDPLCCIDMGGKPEGAGTDCASTICETEPYTPKNWYQAPDLSELGMDVNATWPMYVLADDFQCTEATGIQEIHIWGSWYNDIYPGADPDAGIEGDPGNVMFHISIHSDIPAGWNAPWSMPGEMLMHWYFEPYDFIYKPVKLLDDYEGWFNPPMEWEPMGDRNCWEYIFQFDASNWFEQWGSEHGPVIYWLDVQAMVPQTAIPAHFGWKTSLDLWNDDAVWTEGEDMPHELFWMEMRYPDMHPYFPESINQAFLIGGPCDCEPGEADGLVLVNILDIVWMINYKYKEGPRPVPYALCSGDTNCDCSMNILDIVYLINYKYKFGPAPCTCGNFIANCGGPLR